MISGDIIRPVDAERDESGGVVVEPGDDTGILDLFPPEVLAGMRVRRIEHTFSVGNSDTPLHEGLVRVHSPNDDHYEALIAEAGPDGIPHHPV